MAIGDKNVLRTNISWCGRSGGGVVVVVVVLPLLPAAYPVKRLLFVVFSGTEQINKQYCKYTRINQ